MGGKGSKGAREYRGKEEGMGPLPSHASRAPPFGHLPRRSRLEGLEVTQIEIRVLKGLRRFEMRSHVKNSLFPNGLLLLY